MLRRRIRDAGNGPATFVAASTTITGSVTGPGPFVFCGTVEGDCDIDGTVTLAAGGHWKGTLRANDVIVAGTVDGDVIARRQMEIAATARVTGSLSGHSIAIAEGAVIEGDIQVAGGGAAHRFREKRAD